MIQPSHLRSLLPFFIFASVVFVGACGSSAPTEQTNKVTPSQPSPAAQPSSAATAKAKLNLNEASETEIMTIPGMTKRMVHEFEEYRPYKSIQQFRKEMAKYVSPTVIADYEKYVYVPISENGSDAATLQQMPGLDAVEAEALIKARPYASPEAFIEKLSPMLTPEELTVAKTYIR
jgi:DNA uptake protein ComE-like DNA-binding protein